MSGFLRLAATGAKGRTYYDANWVLIVDNLSDFAHLTFVHTNTLGGSEEYGYKTKPADIERLDNGFRVERWHMNSAPPPFHKNTRPSRLCAERRGARRG